MSFGLLTSSLFETYSGLLLVTGTTSFAFDDFTDSDLLSRSFGSIFEEIASPLDSY